MLPLLSYQKLTNHIDGTTAPSATITSGDQSIPNPAFTTWNDFDQRAVILLNSSLTEEAAAEVLGLTTAHAIWTALETAYSNSSVERIHSLRDSFSSYYCGESAVYVEGIEFRPIDKVKRLPTNFEKIFKLCRNYDELFWWGEVDKKKLLVLLAKAALYKISNVDLFTSKPSTESRKDGWMKIQVWKFNSAHEFKDDSLSIDMKFTSHEGPMSALIGLESISLGEALLGIEDLFSVFKDETVFQVKERCIHS
ncbi:kinase-like domain, phloem protein 2-like protein [Tanacetum coccineum]|uniref:Kinase-like domain, phloem protein 2-like protein n=1 Tax=Tanacetum coccineum TaxID=301880 RepID=A0ABQ5DIH2_9ASTR